MTDRKLMQMALDALEWCYDVTEWPASGKTPQDRAIEALRAALAQPDCACDSPAWCKQYGKCHRVVIGLKPAQQEPVAWMHTTATGDIYFRKNPHDKVFSPQPVYTAPPQREWQGLTDEEMQEAMEYWSDPSRSAYGGAWRANGEYVDMVDTWRYIEAKLKEKNA